MHPMNTLRLRRRLLAAVMVSTMAPAMSLAGHRGSEGADRHDHDRARQALQQGEVRSIAEILKRVEAQVPGEVIEVELERKRRSGETRWVYEIKLIAPDGRLLEVLVDAPTAEILVVEED
nr:PepSY domain-containing protein [Thiocapsa rosea]